MPTERSGEPPRLTKADVLQWSQGSGPEAYYGSITVRQEIGVFVMNAGRVIFEGQDSEIGKCHVGSDLPHWHFALRPWQG